MSRSDLTDDVLAARVRAACEAQTHRVAVADAPFDPGAAAPAGLPVAPAGPRRHRVLLAAAAIAVVAALAGAAVVIGADDGSDQLRTATTTTPAVPAGDWLAPSTAPLGLDLRSVTWSAEPPGDGFVMRTQLFETADGNGAVYLAIQPGGGNVLGDPGPTVQGHQTGLMHSKYGDGVTMSWRDEDTSVDAQWVGMEQADAAALLDGLRPRGGDPMAGFDVAPGASASLVDEAVPDQVSHDVELVYAPPSGADVDGVEELRINTSVGDGSSWAGVESQFFARFPDGRDSEEFQTDPALRQLEEAAPGRIVRIDAGPSEVTDAQLQAIADSLAPIDEAGLRALERQTPGAELASDPPVTSSTTSAPSDPRGISSTDPLAVPLEQADGSGPTTLHDLADGRPMVVVMWQTYCVPCIRYLQALSEDAAAHPDRAVVAVATEDTEEQVEAFVRASGVDLPILLDPDGVVFRGWDAGAVPYTVEIDAEGRVAGGAPGDLTDNDEGEYFLDQFFDG